MSVPTPPPEETSGPTTVLCAALGPVEGEAVALLAQAQAQVNLTRRCADIAELLAASAAGLGRVAVVSADLVGLDRPVVAALHGDGTRVVVLCGEGDPWQHDRLRALGVDAVLDAGRLAQDLLATVRTVAAGRAGRGAFDESVAPGGRAPGLAWSSASPGGRADLRGPRDAGDARDPGGPAGGADARRPAPVQESTIVAVWGPTGAPGRSTVALNLAAELAAPPPRRGRRRALRGAPSLEPAAGSPTAGGSAPSPDVSLLVDADTYSGALAQMTGLLDESSGIAAACRAASQGTLSTRALAALTPLVGPQLRLLSGIARASRWPELPESALEVVWQECRALARWTVVDCGFALERDEMLSYDTRAPQRNAATLSALGAADLVVVVGGSDAVSVQRLVRGLDDLRGSGVVDVTERVVVLNRVRASAVGHRPGPTLREALLRYASVGDVHLLPEDQPSCDTALLSGRTLAEAAPSSALRRAVVELAARVREQAPRSAVVTGARGGPGEGGGGPAGIAAPWSATVAH